MDPAPTPSTSGSHLSFPTPDTSDVGDALGKTPPIPLLNKDRLYVGNLHPTVDEYTLFQVFSKFGKVTKLDFLFHTSGLSRGKPRGYAFIEYEDQNDATKALAAANGKLLRGRQIIVSYAHQAPPDHSAPSGHGVTKIRKGITEASRPTTLSMLKTGIRTRKEKTKDKIAMMEAKLRQMEESHFSSTMPTMPLHPSLPAKPLPYLLGDRITRSVTSHQTQPPALPPDPRSTTNNFTMSDRKKQTSPNRETAANYLIHPCHQH